MCTPSLSRMNAAVAARALLALCPLSSLPLLAGCGSGSGSIPTANSGGGAVTTSGRAAFTVRWPAATRLVPFAANSIRINVTLAGSIIATRVLTKPSGGGTVTTVIDGLPVTDVTVSAMAYPSTDGTGVGQATAQTVVHIVAGQTIPVTLTMESTIDHLEASPSSVSLIAGRVQPLVVTAKDASGAIVVTSPVTITRVSSNTGVATVEPDGSIQSQGAGGATITITETESNKFVGVPVTVVAEPQPIAWWKADNSAADATGGGHDGTLANVTFTPGVSGQAFLYGPGSAGVNVPDSPAFKLDSLTIDAWVNLNQYPPAANLWSMILFRGDSRNGLDPYFLGVRSDGTLIFEVDQFIGVNGGFSLPAPDPFPLNRWVHVTATLDTTNGVGALYVDGQLVAQGVTGIHPLQDLDPNFNPGIGIGNHSNTPNAPYNFTWAGAIDDVKLYNQVVPPSAP